MNARKRLEPSDRKPEILQAAAQVAIDEGLHKLTLAATARRAECAPGLVSHYFKTVSDLRKAVMREAIKRGSAEIIAEGLALRDPIAVKASPELIAAARAILASRGT